LIPLGPFHVEGAEPGDLLIVDILEIDACDQEDSGLQRASFRELRQFLTTRQAEAVMAGLCMSSVVETERALAGPLNTPETVYAANREMRWLKHEVVRVMLLNAHYFCVTSEAVCKGTVDETTHPSEQPI
jgi:DNA repair protein RadC